MMKPFVLMRVKYSRLTIRRSLRTGGPIDKDFVQRWFQKFETNNAGVRLQSGFQDLLRVGAGFSLISTPFPKRVMLVIAGCCKKASLPVNSMCKVFLP